MADRLFSFEGSARGPWRVTRQTVLAGDSLPPAERLDVSSGDRPGPASGWVLRGITSNERYVERAEKVRLLAKQQGLGRSAATCAALIPIRKSSAWWALTQDERRAVLESRSHHILIGSKYLPAIARRLHHCRDLSDAEPFDFLTWFEFAPADEQSFDALLAELRASEEWRYVDRELDIRLTRD